MQVKELRDEGAATAAQARRDQDLSAAKRWVFANWPDNDWQDITHAICDAVNAECLLRDEREHQIPLSGKLYNETPVTDPATGAMKYPPVRVDPRRMGLRHGHREVRLETRRRLHALTLLRPEPSTFFELQRAIVEDDGKDADGRWLCNRCVPQNDPKHEAHPDGSGFDERLPRWVGVDLTAKRPASNPPPANETATQGEPSLATCPDCAGVKAPHGYYHTESCPRRRKRAAVVSG